jgi:uncharacterized protein YndB with AHSA1/START domain
MHPDELFTVRRTVSLNATADEVWNLLTDETELARWFSHAASLDPVPGGLGRFVDGHTVRTAVVQRVETGRRIGFTWWDESRPEDASTVELLIDDMSADGQVQLTITETLVASGGSADMRACSWTDVADSWDSRLGALGALADRFVARCSPLAR